MNCLACFHWTRHKKDYLWGTCDNRQGIQLEPNRAALITKEDFSCSAFSAKFQASTGKHKSVKVEPQHPWDQGGDVNPQKIH
jgi:hypothetical protein